MTAPQKKSVPQWQAFPNGMKTAARWLVSESQRCTCKHVLKRWGQFVSENQRCLGKHVLERWSWLVSESQRCTCKHILERWRWLASERAMVLLVNTSKVTEEQALQVWEWNIRKQQQRWRWRQVLERCCPGSSRGETDDFGPFQAPYIPQEVGRVTIWLLSWVVVNRVKSLWESWRVFWDTGRCCHIACYCW